MILKAAIDLLCEHDTRKVVRKCHFAHTKAHVRTLLNSRRYAERTADDKAYPATSGHGKGAYPLRKVLAFKLYALDAHCNNIGILA